MLSPQEYATRYLSAEDQYTLQNMIEVEFLRELMNTIRANMLLNNKQLVPVIEDMQLKWFSMWQIVRESYIPGMLPIDPAGFLKMVQSFFPQAYTAYKELHP